MTYLLIVALLGFVASSQAWKSCSPEDGGGVCPVGNHCCRTSTPGVSSCISETLHLHNGTSMCCDDINGLTGCGVGYGCETTYFSNDTISHSCVLIDKSDDEKPNVLPQYRLCSLTNESLKLHTVSVNPTAFDAPKLAYFSSMGSIEDDARLRQHQSLTHIFIIVHGSGRNADDYLCGGISSVLSKTMQKTTMVFAPWFLAPGDGDSNIPNDVLRWTEKGPIPHTWRYGAEATDNVTSSYQVMDAMVEQIMFTNIHRFPNLQRIIVAGHSAGGQFTHRWTLTSNSAIWGDGSISNQQLVPIRVVVANPRSFCYLDKRRYTNGIFTEPNASRVENCPGYNRWEWGLEMDSRVPMPHHVRELIESHGGNTTWLTNNYAKRDVVYLAGSLDILPVRSECEDDDFQGACRFERSKLYFDSLQEFYKTPTHRRLIADGVSHDHCLMFQSVAGQQALFGDFTEAPASPFINLTDPQDKLRIA